MNQQHCSFAVIWIEWRDVGWHCRSSVGCWCLLITACWNVDIMLLCVMHFLLWVFYCCFYCITCKATIKIQLHIQFQSSHSPEIILAHSAVVRRISPKHLKHIHYYYIIDVSLYKLYSNIHLWIVPVTCVIIILRYYSI